MSCDNLHENQQQNSQVKENWMNLHSKNVIQYNVKIDIEFNILPVNCTINFQLATQIYIQRCFFEINTVPPALGTKYW